MSKKLKENVPQVKVALKISIFKIKHFIIIYLIVKKNDQHTASMPRVLNYGTANQDMFKVIFLKSKTSKCEFGKNKAFNTFSTTTASSLFIALGNAWRV